MVEKSSYPEACVSNTKQKTPSEMSSHFILRLYVKSHYLKLRRICSTTDASLELIPYLCLLYISDEFLNVLKKRI